MNGWCVYTALLGTQFGLIVGICVAELKWRKRILPRLRVDNSTFVYELSTTTNRYGDES